MKSKSAVIKERYLKRTIEEFLEEKMVFLGGPRQVGKTTLTLSFLSPPRVTHPAYLNWDVIQSRSLIRQGTLPSGPLVILDGIHKYKLWRNLVKGFFDQNRGYQNYIVTGSARLDFYRRGGDSLLGRYRYVRLHPFSVSELKLENSSDIKDLLMFGGFPEPWLAQSGRVHRLWCRERLYRIVYDDISNLETLREYSRIELLAELMATKAGGLLSIRSLEEDLQVSHKTITHWLDILERVYYVYRIYPYHSSKIRALKKMAKVYLWDWSEIEDQGAKFENMVASHLLKYCHFLEDSEGEKMELRFLRDADQRELDFIVLKNKKPLFGVECKQNEKVISQSLSYFKDRISIPRVYQVHLGTGDFLSKGGIRVIPFAKFCKELQLP